MARITLSNQFTLIPEGTHIFKITAVEYKPDFGKLNVTMETKNGEKHIERFTLINAQGQPNNGGINAFTFFARTALQDFSILEIDHTDLVGKFIKCAVTHNKVASTKKEGEFVTFVQLGDKAQANGFDDTPVEKKDNTPTPKKPTNINLDDLLGD